MKKIHPLNLTLKTYYWKPMAALFRASEMRLYRKLNASFPNPILDLGCGDGGVAKMLQSLGVAEQAFCGLEISLVELKKAKATGCHRYLIQGDANYLPFKDNVFASGFSNGVFCSIPGGVDLALKEAERVLAHHADFVITVPTHDFNNVLLWPKVLGAFSKRLSQWYLRRLNNRLPHFQAYSPEKWMAKLQDNGFSIVKSTPFFSSKAAHIWNILTLQAFRIWGLSWFLPFPWVRKTLVSIWRPIFIGIYNLEKDPSPPFGYLFLMAKKGVVLDSQRHANTEISIGVMAGKSAA